MAAAGQARAAARDEGMQRSVAGTKKGSGRNCTQSVWHAQKTVQGLTGGDGGGGEGEGGCMG